MGPEGRAPDYLVPWIACFEADIAKPFSNDMSCFTITENRDSRDTAFPLYQPASPRNRTRLFTFQLVSVMYELKLEQSTS